MKEKRDSCTFKEKQTKFKQVNPLKCVRIIIQFLALMNYNEILINT